MRQGRDNRPPVAFPPFDWTGSKKRLQGVLMSIIERIADRLGEIQKEMLRDRHPYLSAEPVGFGRKWVLKQNGFGCRPVKAQASISMAKNPPHSGLARPSRRHLQPHRAPSPRYPPKRRRHQHGSRKKRTRRRTVRSRNPSTCSTYQMAWTPWVSPTRRIARGDGSMVRHMLLRTDRMLWSVKRSSMMATAN